MEQFIDFINAVSDRTGRLLAWLILPITFIVLYTAVMRYFFQTSVLWGFEMGLFAFGIHGIVGGSYCLRHGGHVNVDVLGSHLPKRWSALLRVFGAVVVLLVCAGMVYLGSCWAWRSTLILERSIHGTEFNPQIWWFKWMIPLAAALTFIQALADILRGIMPFCGKRRE